jgi:hypothetical protein
LCLLLAAATASGAETLTGPWRVSTDDRPEYATAEFDDRGWASVDRLPIRIDVENPRWYRVTLSAIRHEAIAIPPIYGDYEVFLDGLLIGARVDLYPALQSYRLPSDRDRESVLAIRLRPFPDGLYHLERIAPRSGGEAVTGTAAELTLLAAQTRAGLVVDRMPGMVVWGFQQALVLFLLRLAVRMRRAEAGVFGTMLIVLGSAYLLEEAAVREMIHVSTYARILVMIAALFYGLEIAFVSLYLELRRSIWLRALPYGVAAMFLIAPFPSLAAAVQVGCVAAVVAHWRLPQSRWLVVAFSLLAGMLLLSATNDGGLTRVPLAIQLSETTIDLSSITTLWLMVTMTISLADRSTEAQRYQDRMARELSAGAMVQDASLRSGLERVEGMQIRHAYLPAQEVGGDFYQVKALPTGEALVLVGDVSGKGLSAALTVSELLGAFRALSTERMDPGALLTALNRIVCERKGEGFVTACCLRIGRGRVRVANAGHLPPFVDGREWACTSALPLGLVAGLQYEARDGQGRQVVLMTDGVAEARNEMGELFGFDRTLELLEAGPEALAAAAASWGQEDDITVIELREA